MVHARPHHDYFSHSLIVTIIIIITITTIIIITAEPISTASNRRTYAQSAD